MARMAMTGLIAITELTYDGKTKSIGGLGSRKRNPLANFI